jgi:hypothetical protein
MSLEVKPEVNPLRFPELEPHEIEDFRALAKGLANEVQQRRAMDTLVYKLCDTYGNSFRLNIRQTDLALGKQLVGQRVVWILNHAKTGASVGKQMIKDLENYDARSSNFAGSGDSGNDSGNEPDDGNDSGFNL